MVPLNNIIETYMICMFLRSDNNKLAWLLPALFVFVLAYKVLRPLAKITVCLSLPQIFQSTIFRSITYIMILVKSAIFVT